MSLQRMAAEVIFGDPNDVTRAECALLELDCDFEVLDWTDPGGGPHMWAVIRTVSRLDRDDFFGWLKAVIEPLGGDVLGAGLAADVERDIRANAQ